MRTAGKLTLAGVATFGFALILYLTARRHVVIYDESIVMVGALRVMAGELPSADFYVNYGPLQFYILAGLYELFGPSVLIGRLYDAVIAGAILTAMAGCLWRAGLLRYAPLAVAGGFAVLHLGRMPLNAKTVCTLLLLVGAWLLIRILVERRSQRSYLPLALVLAVAVAFRYDFLVVAGAAFSLPIIVVGIVDAVRDRATAGQTVRHLAAIAGILAAAVALVLMVIWLAGILGTAIDDILVHNMGNYAEMRRMPFPGLAELFVKPARVIVIYLPHAALALAALAALLAGRTMERRVAVALLVLASVTACGAVTNLIRTDLSHAIPGSVSAVVLAALALGALEARFRVPVSRLMAALGGRIAARALVALVLGGLLAVFAANRVHLNERAAARLVSYNPFVGDKPSVRQRLRPFNLRDESIADAARYIREVTEPGERILSVTGRHDKILINNMLIYMLSGRLPAGRYAQYDAGVQTTEAVQRALIEALEAEGVSLLLVDPRWDDRQEPNGSALSSGVLLLDTYIAENFAEDRRFGDLRILRRTGAE